MPLQSRGLDERAMQKRGLTYREAARRAGVCVTTYRKRVQDGILPGPMPGHGRIDAEALELAMDRWSGITHGTTEPVSDYEQWKARCDKN